MKTFPYWIAGALALWLVLPVSAQDAATDTPPAGGRGGGMGRPGGGGDGDGVTLQFPLNAVTDILPVYERLTGKVVMKDSAVFNGPQISLVTPRPVPNDEAIRLIESALILNGYVVIHESDQKSIKLLLGRAGEAANNFNDGEVIFTDPMELPGGEALIGFFMKLNHISPEDAGLIMSNHVQLNPYGRITPVESPPGLLITESAALVRKMAKLREIIDVPPDEARLMTQFVQLIYADSNTVAQIIQAAMDARQEERTRLSELGRTINGQQQQQQNNNNNNNRNQNQNRDQNANQSAGIGSANDPAAQLIADDRLNRIMVQASPLDFAFILSLIEEFDRPLPNQSPLEKHLNYAKVIDILPVVVDILTDTGTGTTQLPGGRTIDTRQTPVASSQLQALTGTQNESQQTRFQQQNAADATGGQADRLAFPIDETAPISVLVGKTRVIADRQANMLIVIGSDEAKQTVDELVDRLDRKPPQVYLAMVIGQLTLGDGMDIGVDYLKQFESFNAGNLNAGGLASSLITERDDILSNGSVADVRSNLISNAFGPSEGLNLYGSFGGSFDVFISALETSNQFKVVSRPVLSVQNNKRASITSGQRIPVPESTITDATAGTANAALNTTIAFEDVVLKLEVIPLINADREVTLEIAQINDTVIGQQIVANNSVPIIGTEELTTTLTVPDRHTIVLGGLITESDNKSTEGLPFVNRIPVLGHAFKNTDRDLTRTELLIFIQPVVVMDNHELMGASYDEDLRTEVGADAAEEFPNPGVPTEQRLDADFERSENLKKLNSDKRERPRTKTRFPFLKR
tara:strand:+ start:30011 stop:32428 length:2418 start_codon:yes stop_codon:yes gene_type:complete